MIEDVQEINLVQPSRIFKIAAIAQKAVNACAEGYRSALDARAPLFRWQKTL